jgi:hypothetical protein
MHIRKDTAMSEVPYLAALSRQASSYNNFDEIRRAVDANGFWERYDEWRISTVTTKRIEAAEREGRKGFLVKVGCDHEFSCHCPTLERAVEFLNIYDGLIVDLFYTVGWPSWAARNRLDP